MTEVETKLKNLRIEMANDEIGAIRFKGADWFSWATGGGSNVVILTGDTGVAEVLVGQDRAFILTNEIEVARLRDEELGPEFEMIVTAWDDPEAVDRFIAEFAGERSVASDRPANGELHLSEAILEMKRTFCESEIARYRSLGAAAAEAMTDAFSQAAPDWSENRLAAEGAKELWRRGIHPTLVLVAGEERFELHRHPFPTDKKLNGRAMMVFCGRRHGLYANLTRIVSFRKPSAHETERMNIVARIEARAFDESRAGNSLAQIYSAIKNAYRSEDQEQETHKQHFGGPTGYLSREAFARPFGAGEKPYLLRENSAVAWNPTLPGSKIEDTVLVGRGGLEILTDDPRWPSFNLEGKNARMFG